MSNSLADSGGDVAGAQDESTGAGAGAKLYIFDRFENAWHKTAGFCVQDAVMYSCQFRFY